MGHVVRKPQVEAADREREGRDDREREGREGQEGLQGQPGRWHHGLRQQGQRGRIHEQR